jgi:hypothetical protein
VGYEGVEGVGECFALAGGAVRGFGMQSEQRPKQKQKAKAKAGPPPSAKDDN